MAAPVVADARRPVALPSATDWLLRPLERIRAPLPVVGAAIALLLFLLFFLVRWQLVGEADVARYAGVDALVAVLFAYLPLATVYLRRSALRDFAELRPVLVGSDAEVTASLGAAVSPGRRVLLLAGLVGSVASVLMPLLDPGYWPEGRPPLLSALFLYHCARQAALGFLIGRVVVAEAAATRAYEQLGATRVRVDLLDLRSLRPFARRGLRSGFVWILCSSLVSLLWLGPGAADANAVILVAIVIAVLGGFARCTAGVRTSIRRAKEAQLSWLRREIRRESEALLGSSHGGGDARLANLIALQGLVERVHEWPFDAPVLLRFALLALLGLLSWLGSALVEHLLDVFLG